MSLDTHPSDILLVSWLKSSWRLLRSAEIYFQDLKNCFEVNIGAWDQMKQHQSVVHHKISWNKRPKKCFLFCSSLRWGSHAIRTQPQLLMNSLDDVPEKNEKLVNYFMTALSWINLHFLSPLTLIKSHR